MKKSEILSEISARSSSSLFGSPVPYDIKEPRKTVVLCASRDSSGNSIVSHECIEDHLEDSIPLDFSDVTLSNLVEKGVDPHSLDIIDTNKLGVDAGVDALAQHITENASSYVSSSKSE